MTLVWRSVLALSLPLSVVACDPEVPDTNDASSSGAGSTTTTTGVDPSTTSGPAVTTTESADSTTDEPGTTTGEVNDAVCNNNILEEGEACDLNQLGGQTCASLGYQGGVLGCRLDCEDYNLLGCFICGNEVVDIAEDCEGSVPKEITCESLGYEAGTIACGDDCLYDLSECSICGDGVQQGPENCDGIDLGGETCVSLGFDKGNLGCVVGTCSYDFSGCAGGMYFQDFEGGVLPPEFTVGGTMGMEVDGTGAIVGAFSAHSAAITHNQTSSLLISGNFAVAGDISFTHSESTENCCDHLEFYIDGMMQTQWSGTNPPAMDSFPVAAGAHDFEWRYDKDGSVNTGSDRVWIDDISMVPGVPI